LWARRRAFRFESTIHGTRHYLFSEEGFSNSLHKAVVQNAAANDRKEYL